MVGMKRTDLRNFLGKCLGKFLGSLLVLSSAAVLLSAGTCLASEHDKLLQIVNEYTEGAKRLDAFEAPIYNVEDQLSQFGDYPAPAFYDREKKLFETTIAKLKTVDAHALQGKDKVLYRLISEDMTVSLEGFKYPRELLDFNQMSNRLHSYIDDSSQDLTNFPFDSVKHYEDFYKRSEGFPAYVDAEIALLRRGIKEKVVLSCAVAERAPNSYKDGLETDVQKNPFYRPLTFMPKDFSDADRKRLTTEYTAMVKDRIIPGFQKFDHFYKTEYLPNCRKNAYGMGDLPNGKEWYKYEILNQTNLAMDPKAIHELGLKEVARISKEMEGIKKEMGFKGSLKDFLKSLTDDPKYFFTNQKDMFNAFLNVKTKTAAVVPQYFKLIPKNDFTIVETSNPEDASGSYSMPTDYVPHGKFVVNTKNLRSVPVYDVTTLMLHETVPGHHFQLALQFEEKDLLTEYQRKIFNSNSFVEGWALYCEYLGNEMGMYKDPIQRLGNRNDEMLRAVRLVVDTGIHAYGWSREKAIAYMTEHLASDPGDISNESNRYSVWPGQALGYKLGQLKIIELRKMAEKELGPKFDIRDFHSRVIGDGTLSLGVLEAQIKDWIAETKKADATHAGL
jgi:uncharacterized protein (DUF885 family)